MWSGVEKNVRERGREGISESEGGEVKESRPKSTWEERGELLRRERERDKNRIDDEERERR